MSKYASISNFSVKTIEHVGRTRFIHFKDDTRKNILVEYEEPETGGYRPAGIISHDKHFSTAWYGAITMINPTPTPIEELTAGEAKSEAARIVAEIFRKSFGHD